jgi:hypothetical protein
VCQVCEVSEVCCCVVERRNNCTGNFVYLVTYNRREVQASAYVGQARDIVVERISEANKYKRV